MENATARSPGGYIAIYSDAITQLAATIPHLSSHGSCKPIDEYQLYRGGHASGVIRLVPLQPTVPPVLLLPTGYMHPINGVHVARSWQ